MATLVAAATVSCGGGGGTGATGSSEFDAAVERMVNLQSVRMTGHASGPDTSPDTLTADYQAPDRLRSVQTGTDDSESLLIGSSLYEAETGRPGYYRPVPLPPGRGGAQTVVFGLLRAMQAGKPAGRNGAYRLTLPGGAGSMVARVADGYVIELTTTDERGVVRVQQYSLFNQAPEVHEPPADRVLAPLTTAPKCQGGQPPPSAFLCAN